MEPPLPPLIRIKPPPPSSDPESNEGGKGIRLSTQEEDGFHALNDASAEGDDEMRTKPSESPPPLPAASENQGPTPRDLEEAVHQVVQVFSKPQPDRDRLFKAVHRAVTGELTIKESSTRYGFATSTMHPYVHRARAILGDKAPPMKSNRVGLTRPGGGAPKSHFKFPPHLQVLKPKPPKGRPMRSGLDINGFSGSEANGALPILDAESPQDGHFMDDSLPVEKGDLFHSGAGTEGSEEAGAENSSLDEDDENASSRKDSSENLFIDEEEKLEEDSLLDESMPPEAVSTEDAAREAMDSITLESDADRMQLFLVLVRCLNGEIDVAEAAETSVVPEELLKDAIARGRTLMGLSQEARAMENLSDRKKANTVEEAVRRATRCSHYQGSDRERLYLAVLQTVMGELPLTQAAATHSVPFSTLHPYVKRAKVILGLSAGATMSSANKNPLSMVTAETPSFLSNSALAAIPGITATGKREASPDDFRRSSGGITLSNSSESPKLGKHRQSAGSGGRHRDELPQFWRENPALMRDGVKRAVQSCQYDDPSKKDRLCSAVVEALLGRKTMKAAAAMHDVPFTTLQTYYHRSRAQLQREVDARMRGEEPGVKLEASKSSWEMSSSRNSPESESSYDSYQNVASTGGDNENVVSRKRALGATFEDLWSKLQARQEDPSENRGATPSSISPNSDPDENSAEGWAEPMDMSVPTVFKSDEVKKEEPAVGSSKRKPKKIIHHTQSSLQEKLSAPSTSKAENDDDLQVFGANNRSVSDYLRDLMAQPNNSDSTVHIVVPQAPEEENGITETYEFPEDKIEDFPDFDMDLSSAILERKQNSTMSTEEAVVRAIKNSQYDGTDRERLREAVLTAVRGDRSMKEASRLFSIPLGTFHTYYHRARNLLDAAEAGMDPDSPAVMALLNTLSGGASSAAKKKKAAAKSKASSVVISYPFPGSPADSDDGTPPAPKTPPLEIIGRKATDDEVSQVVSKVIKNSQYPPEQKLRLQQAVARVIRGDMTINAAANVYQLPSSTVHPYVHRTRAVLGDACPPQAKLTKVGSMSRVEKFADFLSPSEKQSFNKPSPTSSPSGLELQKEISRKAKLMEERRKLAERPTIDPADLSLEDADKVVTELVKSSLYNEEGRQRLYEAILMVVTESATCSEASRAYNIPPSTIQPYVQRARVALNLPLNPSGGGGGSSAYASGSQRSVSARKTVLAPKVYAAPGKEASYEEVEEVVRSVVQNSVQADNRRERLYKAVLAAVSGRKTIKDGCTEQDLPASTVHPYVSRARHMLGSRCPPPKIATLGPSAMGNVRNFYKNKGFPGMPRESSPGGESSNSPGLGGELGEGEENAEEENLLDPTLIIPADPLAGPPEEREAKMEVLQDQLKQILSRYNYRGDRERLIKAIASVIGEGKTSQEISQSTGIAHTTLATYVRIAKQFVQPSEEKRKEGDEGEESLDGESTRSKTVSVARVRSTTNGSTILDAADGPERMKSTLRHLILSLYRRGATQQGYLTDAVLEILFEGKSVASVLENRPGISEHVVSVYVERVKNANAILEEQLPIVYGIAEGSLPEEQLEADAMPAKRARKSITRSPPPSSPSGSPPLTPTRTSRRLQEKAKEVHVPIVSGGDPILSDKMDASLGVFLRRLHATGFPVSTEFLVALVTNILEKDKTSQPREELNPAWAERFRQRHNISGHRISQ